MLAQLKNNPTALYSSMRVQQGCISNCGLCQTHHRHPKVEIEVNENCSLRCPVCFMAAEDCRTAPDPSLKALEARYEYLLANIGPHATVQLTGGEPTIRRDLPDIVRLGRNMGFKSIEVNTNGMVIARSPGYLKSLAEAGISRVYLQFDGLSDSVYERIYGQNLLELKLQTIENCRKAGVQVVLAMTVIEGINDRQLGGVLRMALKNRDVISGIAYQPAFGYGGFEAARSGRLTMGDVIFKLAEQSRGIIEPYDFWPLGCAHPLCTSSTYLLEDEGKIQPLTRRLNPQEYVECFNRDSPHDAVFAEIAFNKFPGVNPGLAILIKNCHDAAI